MLSKDKLDFLRSLADKKGHIEPSTVITAARDPTCILHDEFEWDAEKAAQAHWVSRARELIRYVRIEVTVEHVEFRAPYFVLDPDRPPKTHRYIALSQAAREREKAEAILIEEISRLMNQTRRLKAIAVMCGVEDKLDMALAHFNEIIATAERAEAAAKTKAKASRTRRAGKHRHDARASV